MLGKNDPRCEKRRWQNIRHLGTKLKEKFMRVRNQSSHISQLPQLPQLVLSVVPFSFWTTYPQRQTPNIKKKAKM